MNPNKTISANSRGITINFGDVNKHKFVYYSNDVRKIQNDRKKPCQKLKEPDFNRIQQHLYNQAVYGLKTFPNEVLMELQVEKIRTIQRIHNKAKNVINCYKQEVAAKIVDDLLLKVFPKSPIIKQFAATKGVDPLIKVPTSLKDLNITPYMLAKRLVYFKVLPENFFNLV